MTCAEDTLSRRTLCVLAGRRGRLHLLCVGKLSEKTCFEILSALVLLPSVDEHFVLRDNKEKCETSDMKGDKYPIMEAGDTFHTLCSHKVHIL